MAPAEGLLGALAARLLPEELLEGPPVGLHLREQLAPDGVLPLAGAGPTADLEKKMKSFQF